MSSFYSAKATHIFSAKNIRILYIESAKTVNEMTLNELVKLTKLWTSGLWFFWSYTTSYLDSSVTCKNINMHWSTSILLQKKKRWYCSCFPENLAWPFKLSHYVNPGPVEPRYALLLQTIRSDQLLLKKPTDLELHCLSLWNMWITIKKPVSSNLIGCKLEVGSAS